MKNISTSLLHNFHGMRIEDPKTFPFEFEVLCIFYDYLLYAQKLNYFQPHKNMGLLKGLWV